MRPIWILPVLLVACREKDPNIDTDESGQEDTSASAPLDGDGDGFTDDADCDDGDASIHPDAEETCNGVDDNCDGVVDEDATDSVAWYSDTDQDGYGDGLSAIMACDAPTGHVANGDDCDDTNPQFNPSAIEADCSDPNDYNCDGSVGYADLDGDSHPACEDCDDTVATTNVDAIETCNGVDDDCDGEIDDDAVDATTWYGDADNDGFGGLQFQTDSCTAPTGYVSNADDCNDVNANSHPGASEVCDLEDNDCDSEIDEGVTYTWYADSDNDGYGDATSTSNACTAPPGYVANGNDCDDTTSTTNPGSWEVCDGVDNDCDGTSDEPDALNTTTWYTDLDGDGYGDSSTGQGSCNAPSGTVSSPGDCDDNNAAAHPSASETCDGTDNDCDGTIDEPDAIDASTWYSDLDADSYGDSATATVSCSAPSNTVSDGTDCDDADAAVNPGATESCDSVDNDCDGDTDEPDASDASTYYTDSDSDGYGDSNTAQTACSAPSGTTATSGDCNDADSSINPGATEIWYDSIDSDCGQDNDNDADGDGYESLADAGGLDCDDTDATAWQCGTSSGTAGTSCLALLQADSSLASGTYWIDPDAAGAFEVYCEMSLNGGGWTLVAKLTNQDARHWADDWCRWGTCTTGQSAPYGDTRTLAVDNDAKSNAWARLSADDFLLTDNLNPADYVATNDGCVGSTNLESYFTNTLASFPYTGDNHGGTCSIDYTYQPNWTTEPDWDNQTAASGEFSFVDNQVVIGRTDASGDTSGVVSFYRLSKQESDVGLGALEDGQSFTNNGMSQDIGGPTSCNYDDTECASEYPETVFFYVR
ncbi:MAG: MopE-related protein [Myxococcota bacterium]|nr:MopE-related protein [Myxococcota bacterium]